MVESADLSSQIPRKTSRDVGVLSLLRIVIAEMPANALRRPRHAARPGNLKAVQTEGRGRRQSEGIALYIDDVREHPERTSNFGKCSRLAERPHVGRTYQPITPLG